MPIKLIIDIRYVTNFAMKSFTNVTRVNDEKKKQKIVIDI
jgi:hypothetical protein